MLDKRPQRPKAVPRKIRIRAKEATLGPTSAVSNAGRAAGKVIPAKPVGVFKKPVAGRPFHDDRHRARQRVRETARKVGPEPRVKIAPTIMNPTPRQAKATERVVQHNARVLDVKLPKSAGTFEGGQPISVTRAKEARLTSGDKHTDRALAQIIASGEGRNRRTAAKSSGEASAKKKPSAVGKVYSASVGSGLAEFGRRVKAVAPDSGKAVVDILDETTRPVHGEAGAVKAAIQGKNVPKAFLRGIQNKDKTTFSDVLDAAGVDNKYVKGVAGFGLDVAADPTTYLTLGASVPARAAAKKAAEKEATRGIRVGFKAHVPFTDKTVHVRSSGRASAAVGRGLKRLAGEPGAKAGAKARDALHETVSPATTPSYRTRSQHQTIRAAQREARAAMSTGEKKIARKAQAIKRTLSDDLRGAQRVVQARERAPKNERIHVADLALMDSATRELPKAERRARVAGKRERSALKGSTRPLRTPEVVKAEQKYKRAVRARAKVERSPKATKEQRGAARVRVRETDKALRAARAKAPTLTPKQADRLIFARADERVASERLARVEANAQSVERSLAQNRVYPKDLPPAEQKVVETFAKDFNADLAAKKDRKLGKEFQSEGPHDAQAFFPHADRLDTDPPKGLTLLRQKASRKRAVADKRRVVRLPLHRAENARGPGRYELRPEVAYAHTRTKANSAVALSKMWEKVADTGRPLTRGAERDEHELVYRVDPEGLKPLTDARGLPDDDAIEAAVRDTRNRYVILDKRSVDEVAATTSAVAGSAAGRAYDKVQGATKKIQTVYNPAYQPRNFIGDSAKGWQADTTLKDANQARQGLKARRRLQKFERTPESITGDASKLKVKTDKTLDAPFKLAKAGHTTHRAELEAAEKFGAIGTGQVQADIASQVGGKGSDSKIWRFNEAREDWPRYASYLQARKQGMSQSAAAKHSLDSHIDYNDLTPNERKYARRAFQFYTFFARNTRDQARVLATRPGKMATVEKALEETAKAAGFGSYDEYVNQLEDYEQKGLPVPVRVGGKVYPIFVQPPQTDLNQLTIGGDATATNLANRATFFKLIPELAWKAPEGYSVFFQGPIRTPKAPLVPAPAGLEKVPGAVKLFGMQKYPDKRQGGKMIWGWDARADYISRTMPQSNFGVSFLKSQPDDRNLNGPVALASFLSGVKVTPDKRLSTRINRLYDERQKVQDEKGRLNQLGVYIDGRPVPNQYRNLIPKYKALAKREKEINRALFPLKTTRGDQISPTDPGRPPKGKKSGGSDPWGGGSPSQSSGGSSDPWGGSPSTPKSKSASPW